MANKRITDQTTDAALAAGDYIIVDSETEGSRKYDLGSKLVAVDGEIGDLSELETEDKSNLVAAINEANQNGGSGLTQTEKELILTLFSKAAYAEDDAEDSYEALASLWQGYSVTWQGSGYSKGNNATSVSGGSTFSSTITASGGHTISTVVATMGGVTVQGAWNNGTVTIPNVTGDIVITVTTVQATVTSISALYTQSGTVYDTDSLDSLKSDLVVTATYADQSTSVVPSADYTLSGTLVEGSSTVTVTYGGQTTTFTVTVTTIDTAPDIMTEGIVWGKTAPNTVSAQGFGITEWYDHEFTQEILESSPYWDSTNEYMSTAGWAGIKYCTPDYLTYAAGYSWPASANYKHVIGKDHVYQGYATITRNSVLDFSFSRYSTIYVQANGTSYSIPLLDADYCYAYWSKPAGNNSIFPKNTEYGTIIFAGKYTPYYGLTNINQAPNLDSISATFNQGGAVVTTSSTLDSLKPMLSVSANYDNSKVLPVNLGLVALSGTLTQGTSTITATYNSKSTTFNVTVS